MEAVRPDAVIVATGSLPDMPIIKGLFQTDLQVTTTVEVLSGGGVTGRRVLVLGGGQAGLVTADYLAETGCEVVVLNRRTHYAEEMSSNDRYYLRERLKKGAVRLYKGVAIRGFLPEGVAFKTGSETVTLRGFDSVVLAEKMIPVRNAVAVFKPAGIPVHIIGDAHPPPSTFAIGEGEEIGRAI